MMSAPRPRRGGVSRGRPSLRVLLRALNGADAKHRDAILGALSAADICALEEEWSWQALRGQREPAGDWRVWLISGGRGFGKTLAGAQWVLAQARAHPGARIALVGASLDEVGKVMIEGESGLLAAARGDERLEWRRSRGELRFPSGATGFAFSGASPDGLRGAQHHFAWADEIVKWVRGEAAWDNLELGMRLGTRPRIVVTTTPGRSRLLDRLRAMGEIRVSGGRTYDNPHLPGAFVRAVEDAYAGTRLGRQELDGETLGEIEGALWTRDTIEAARCAMPALDTLARVVVGVDPPAGASGDRCGIIVCGQLKDGRGVVLADRSVARQRPHGWARAVAAAAAAWGADRVIAEANNGGLMVEEVLRAAAPGLPLQLVHARRGKAARAEPVALAFESGRALFAGCFRDLEDELTALGPNGFAGPGSPDRADAMVWAMTVLVVRRRSVPRVRRL